MTKIIRKDSPTQTFLSLRALSKWASVKNRQSCIWDLCFGSLSPLSTTFQTLLLPWDGHCTLKKVVKYIYETLRCTKLTDFFPAGLPRVFLILICIENLHEKHSMQLFTNLRLFVDSFPIEQLQWAVPHPSSHAAQPPNKSCSERLTWPFFSREPDLIRLYPSSCLCCFLELTTT